MKKDKDENLEKLLKNIYWLEDNYSEFDKPEADRFIARTNEVIELYKLHNDTEYQDLVIDYYTTRLADHCLLDAFNKQNVNAVQSLINLRANVNSVPL